jgi:hypothetical protein
MQMHSNLDSFVRQILWTLNFAALLVLLVTLLGRDRVRRYPWFTASTGFFALRLLAEELLANRIAPLFYQEILLALSDAAVIVGLLVLVELARRAFAGTRSSMWIVNATGTLLVAGGVVAALGPWPEFKNLAWNSTVGKLQLMQLVALKGDMLVSLLAVQLGLLVAFFGRSFKAGWQSHTQKILIGISTMAITSATMQIAVQSILRSARAHPPSAGESHRIIGLIDKLANANRVIYIAVLLWWIYWLWRNEPGAAATTTADTKEEPEATEE